MIIIFNPKPIQSYLYLANESLTSYLRPTTKGLLEAAAAATQRTAGHR